MACGRNREYNPTYSWQKVEYAPVNYTPVNCTAGNATPANCSCANCAAATCTQVSTVNNNCCENNCCEANYCEDNCCQAYNGNGFEWMAAMQAATQSRCGCGCAEAVQAEECCPQKEQFLIEMLRVLLHMLRRNCGNCET